jgi:hypothetical protein
VKTQDAAGRPLLGVDAWGAANRVDGDSCTVFTQENAAQGLLIFYEAKRKLAATLTLKAGEKLPPIVIMKPMGSVKGRLLDANGKPLAGIVVDPHYRDETPRRIDSIIHEARPTESDANGAFTLDSLIPELPFEPTFRRGRGNFERIVKSSESAIQVKPGTCHDLESIKLKPVPEKAGE